MTFVIDASALASFLLPDEEPLELPGGQPFTHAFAPTLLWIELRNLLLVAERRGRLTVGSSEPLLAQADDLNITVDRAPRSDDVLSLARDHRLTAYDALYLELALRREIPLLTNDRALLAAFERQSGMRPN